MHCSKCIFHGGIGVRVTLQAASCSIQLVRWARGPAAAHTLWKHCGHKPAALPEPFATDLLQSECMWNSFTMLLWKVNLFQIYNKTNFKLLSNCLQRMIRLCPCSAALPMAGATEEVSLHEFFHSAVTGQPNILRATFGCLYIVPHCAELIHSLHPFCTHVLRSLPRSFRTPFLNHTWCAIPATGQYLLWLDS